MAITKKPYAHVYSSSIRYLIEEGIMAGGPIQKERDLQWADGVDIVFTLHNLTPANFQKYSEVLLLAAYQEAMRYNEYKWKFASFDVKLGRLAKGKDLPEIATFTAAMHDDADIMVNGPGYETPRREFLINKVEDIVDLAKRYSGKLNVQRPYKVLRMTVSIRQPREK